MSRKGHQHMFSVEALFNPITPLISKRSHMDPGKPGDLVASLQFVCSRVKDKPQDDWFELTRDDVSQLENQSHNHPNTIHGPLGEDGPGFRGPHSLMYHMFFVKQFDEIAPIDGNPDSISVNDLVVLRPGLTSPSGIPVPEAMDALTLTQKFQSVLKAAGKQNGELTARDLDQRALRQPLLVYVLKSAAQGWEKTLKSVAFFLEGNRFNSIAGMQGNRSIITLDDLVVRHPELPELRKPTPGRYPIPMPYEAADCEQVGSEEPVD